MTKKSRLTRIAASLMAMLLAFGLFLSAAPTAYAANTGTLTLYKLDSEGFTYAQVGGTGTNGDPVANYYYDSVTDRYYAYLAGAGYTIYEIGTIDQVTTTDPVTSVTTTEMVYKPVTGLVDNLGAPITTIDSNTDASDIDITASGLSVATGGTLQTTTNSGPLTFSNLSDQGVYLVKESPVPSSVSSGNDFIISVPLYNSATGQWDYNISAFPKNVANSGSVTKDVTAVAGSPVSSSSTKTYNANVGEKISYQVDVTVPSDYDDDNTATLYYTKFSIVDTPSSYLQIDPSTVAVYLNGSATPLASGSDYTATVDSLTGKLTIDFTLSVLTASDTIKVIYDAEILTGGTGQALTNDVLVDFTTNTGSGTIIPKPIDPDPVVTVYSYGIKKVDESGAALGGATFILATYDTTISDYVYYEYDSTTETWTQAANKGAATPFITTTTTASPLTATTDEAILQFYNLTATDSSGAIEYYLFETVAPSTYVAPSSYSLKFTVDSASSAAVASTYDASGNYQADTGYTTQIKNIKNTSNIIGNYLPSTGGTGTLMFLIIGLLLIGGAVTLYVRSRRSDKSAN